MSGGVQKRWLSVKSRIIRSYFEKKPRSRKKSKKVKKRIKLLQYDKKIHMPGEDHTPIDDELQLREADVTRREGVLDRLTDDIGRMISDIAERLGVGDSLRPIRCGKPFRTAAVQYCVTHHSGAPFSVGPCVRPLLAGPAHCL